MEAADKTQACILTIVGSQAMTWDPLDQMAALISSHVNTDRHRDAITDSGPTGPGIFYTRAQLAFYSCFSKFGRWFLRIDSRTKRRQCLLEYTKF